MIRCLLPCLNLAKADARVPGGVPKHLLKARSRHKVAAGAGGEIAAPGKQLHGPPVDLPVTPVGAVRRSPAFREGGRVQDDIVPVCASLGGVRQKAENVRLTEFHLFCEAVERGIFRGLFQGVGGNIHRSDLGRPGFGGIEGKGAGMGEAVQHPASLRQLRGSGPIVLLVKEKAGLLPVDIVHVVADTVFRNDHVAVKVCPQAGKRNEPADVFQALFGPQRRIAPLIDRPDADPQLAQLLRQQAENELLAPVHSQGEHFHHQNVLKTVHRQAGKLIGFPEDQAAGAKILANDRPAVLQSIDDAAAVKRFVKAIIGIAGDDADPDFGMVVDEAGAQPFPLGAQDVHNIAALPAAFGGSDLFPVDPGVALTYGALRFCRDLELWVIPFHVRLLPIADKRIAFRRCFVKARRLLPLVIPQDCDKVSVMIEGMENDMELDFFSHFTDELLRRWPDKGVARQQVTGALKTSLNAEELVNALSEVFRLSPKQMEAAVSELGLGELIAQQRLRGGVGGEETEALPLCQDASRLEPFPELFRFYSSPDPRGPVSLPKGLGESVYALSRKVAESAANDPFLELYHEQVGEYYHSFMTETAPLIRGEIQRRFGPDGLKYLVTTGIGANEQFCHYAAALNNRSKERKVNWIVIHSPLQLKLLPPDAREDNTLFMEFSRSSVTEETIKLHEYTSRKLRRIVFTNGGNLKKLAERDGNLILPMPDRVSGRFGRNKTPILLAPMLACGMDTDDYWAMIQKAIRAFDLKDPDSLPHLLARFILAFQKARGTDFIYLGCNDEELGLLADEFIQFWNEGVNKNGNDLLVSRFFGLPRDSHMNLEGVLGNRETKLGFFLLRDDMRSGPIHPLVREEIDPADPAHLGLKLGDEEVILALANYKRFSEVMPSILIRVCGELSMAHSAVLGQLFSDVTFVYSRMAGIDPGSNPEVKFVRERSGQLLGDFARQLREGKDVGALFGESAIG